MDAEAPPDLDGLCRQLVDVRAQIAALKETERDLELALAPLLPWQRQHEVAGVARFEKHRGKDRKEWDSAALAALVAAKSRDERKVDKETGEVLEDETSACLRVLSECCRFSWRLTPLRARGIDPDEYSATSPGAVSITIIPVAESGADGKTGGEGMVTDGNTD